MFDIWGSPSLVGEEELYEGSSTRAAEPARNRALEDEICELQGVINQAHARMADLVADMDEKETWAEHQGVMSPSHWITWRCGISSGAAKDLLGIARKLRELPRISRAFDEGKLSLSQVKALCRVSRPETEDDMLNVALYSTVPDLERFARTYRWADGVNEAERTGSSPQARRYLKTFFDEDGDYRIFGRLAPEDGAVVNKALDRAQQRVGKRDLEEETDAEAHEVGRADALVEAAAAYLKAANAGSSMSDRYQVMVHVDLQTLMDQPGGEICHLDEGIALSPETLQLLACDASLVSVLTNGDEILSVGHKTRTLPRRIRRALNARDQGCRFPGCTNRAFLDAHHLVFWGNFGPNSLSNLMLLCTKHHAAVHKGLLRIEKDPIEGSRFFRPDGSEIPKVPKGPPGMEVDLEELQQELGVTAETCRTQWDGTPMDVSYVVDVLLSNHIREHLQSVA